MITGKNAELYFGESVYKQMNIEVVGTGIVIDNSMREQGTFTLTETLCDSSELKFGSCLPNQISFVGREIPASIKGKRLHPVEILEGNEDDPFEYGTYTVYSDVPTSDRTKRQITAYDAMYDIINADVKSWYAGLSFPMKLKAFRYSFFSYLGIAQKETTLVNDGMTVNKTLIATQTDSESTITEGSSISGKTVIEAICEINGVFGNINHDGEFEYVELEPIIQPLYPSNDLYPREDLFPRDPNTISMTGHYITFDYEDFQSKAITQLEIRPSDDSAGVIVGTSGNNYVISGNFLVSDKTGAELETIAENTLSVIKKVAYIPIKSSEIVGNPCIELGDPIRFNTTREIVESYVLQRTLTGIQSKRDSITSLGTETHSQNLNGIKGQIESVTRRTNKLERTADHTLSELADLDANTTSRFEQTAEQIQTEVTRATGAESTLQSSITQTAEQIQTEVTRATGAESALQSSITQTAESITAEVTRAQGAEESLGSQITQTAESITAEVTRAQLAEGQLDASLSLKLGRDENDQVVSMINASADQIKLTGNRLIVECNNFELDSSGRVHIIDSLLFDSGDATGVEIIGHDGKHNALLRNINLDIESVTTPDGFKLATKNDIPDMSNYLKKNENGKFNADYASSAGGLSGKPSVDLNNCKASNFYFIGSPDAGSSLLPIGYNSKTYHFGHYTGSSERFKNRISDVEEPALDPHRLYDAKICQYKYNTDYLSNPCDCRYNRFVIGFIAEDLETVYPVAVDKDDDGVIMDWNYKYVIPPMLALIQEQHKDIELLKQENLALQNRLSILEQKMEVLENAYNNKNN